MLVLIPVKNTTLAKSRLNGVLSTAQRRHLVLTLLRGVLRALAGSSVGLKAGALIHVVSDDPLVKEIASDFGVGFFDDAGCDGLNTALKRAAQSLVRDTMASVSVLPADLPLIMPEDVDALLFQSGAAPRVTIAPALRDQGTNALRISPPGLIDFSFGPGSFDRHCSAACTAHATLTILHRPGLSCDLDTPEEFSTYAGKPACHVAGRRVTFIQDR